MKNKFYINLAGGAMAAILFLAGGTGFIANAQDQPPPADNSAPDASTALPSNIDPASPLAQVVKLIQSGVSEAVIMAYVTNSYSAFDLNPDKIIYLKDIGAPDDLVTAMMQHDQALQAQSAGPASQPPPEPAPIMDNSAPDAADVAPPPADVTVDYFYDTLAPYGVWVDVGGYGRCWRPTAVVYNADWQPYCDHGHWVWTDDGWYWISDYSWGWAPFHYGRWFRDARFGWCWCPDTVWGPSWVTWRYSSDYCGWAPLPPRCVYREGIGLVYNGVAVGVGFDFGLNVNCFTFVPTRNFCDPHPRQFRVKSGEALQVFNRTTVINNFGVDSRNRTFINHGIDPERITAVTRTEIHPVAIRDATGPVARGEQLGRDGQTLVVTRPHFTGNPPPMNRSEAPHATSPAPMVGSPYQQPDNRVENNNSQPPTHYKSTSPAPGEYNPSPGNHSSPITPVQPSAPNYNSTDNRRYPSPKMEQMEKQNPRMNTEGSDERVTAPVTTPSPPTHQPEANYSAPPVERSQPAQGNQSHGAPPSQSQRSGGNKNQNGQ